MNLSLDTQILYSPAMSKNGARPDFQNQPGKKITIFIDCPVGCFGPPSELFCSCTFFVCVWSPSFFWGGRGGAAQEDYLFQIARKEYTHG